MLENLTTMVDQFLFYLVYKMTLSDLIVFGIILVLFIIFKIDVSNTYTKKTNGVITKQLVKTNKWPNRLLKIIWLIILIVLFSHLCIVLTIMIASIIIMLKNIKYLERLKPVITQYEIDKI